MLNKRMNILFDEKLFNHLAWLARKNKISIGELVRKAVRETYLNKENQQIIKAYNEILKLRKKIKPFKLTEIKELINYGRRY